MPKKYLSTTQSDGTGAWSVVDGPDAMLNFNGAIATKTGAYTVTSADGTILCNAAAGGFTITLPAANTVTGQIFCIKKIDTTGNVVTVAAASLEGSTSQTLDAQWETITVQSNGSVFVIIEGYNPETRFSQAFQTTNATPTVAYSVPIPAGTAAYVQIAFCAATTNFSNCAGGEADAVFRRMAAGNVARATGSAGLLDAAIKLAGDFTSMPKAEIVANTGTQTADIRLTGVLATTVNWTFTVNVRRIAL